jgi:tetratricopeptide (TPR) repeat protein
MAWWGVAHGLGPNYNMDVTPETELAAFEAIQKAVKLKANASQHEQDYIDALAKRFTDAPNPDLKQSAQNYAAAMRELSRTYPDDTHAATLFADAMMCLKPWKLWTLDHRPTEGTPEIVATLERVLEIDPNHVGANHLYIHAVEASASPERALPSAERLVHISPGSGHLVHMPSHIFQLVGDYHRSAMVNETAIRVDDAYFRSRPKASMYRVLYYNHNVHFAAISHAFAGKYASARRFAASLREEVTPLVKEMPMIEQFATIEGFVMLQFADWQAILHTPQPPVDLKVTTALWHFNQGMACAATGKTGEARNAQSAFQSVRKSIAPETIFGMMNNVGDVLTIADHLLAAKIAEADGQPVEAIARLQQAVTLQDRLAFEEPPPWPISVRQHLGAVLLKAGRASDAERVFREDLERNPRHGRSLFGLRESLQAQGKSHDARLVDRQLEEAWKYADVKLSLKDL